MQVPRYLPHALVESHQTLRTPLTRTITGLSCCGTAQSRILDGSLSPVATSAVRKPGSLKSNQTSYLRPIPHISTSLRHRQTELHCLNNTTSIYRIPLEFRQKIVLLCGKPRLSVPRSSSLTWTGHDSPFQRIAQNLLAASYANKHSGKPAPVAQTLWRIKVAPLNTP